MPCMPGVCVICVGRVLRVCGDFAEELGVDLGRRILRCRSVAPRGLEPLTPDAFVERAVAGPDIAAYLRGAQSGVLGDQLQNFGAAADDEGRTGVRGRVLGAHPHGLANGGGLGIKNPAASW